MILFLEGLLQPSSFFYIKSIYTFSRGYNILPIFWSKFRLPAYVHYQLDTFSLISPDLNFSFVFWMRWFFFVAFSISRAGMFITLNTVFSFCNLMTNICHRLFGQFAIYSFLQKFDGNADENRNESYYFSTTTVKVGVMCEGI